MPHPETDLPHPDGGTPPAHREGTDSAAAAALALDVDTGDVPTTDPETVGAALRGGDPVTVLDVRGDEEVAAWRIESDGVEDRAFTVGPGPNNCAATPRTDR